MSTQQPAVSSICCAAFKCCFHSYLLRTSTVHYSLIPHCIIARCLLGSGSGLHVAPSVTTSIADIDCTVEGQERVHEHTHASDLDANGSWDQAQILIEATTCGSGSRVRVGEMVKRRSRAHQTLFSLEVHGFFKLQHRLLNWLTLPITTLSVYSFSMSSCYSTVPPYPRAPEAPHTCAAGPGSTSTRAP